MKVLAFNGSPRMNKSNTSLILDPFLEGMRESRAEVELFYTKKLNVNPCQGERYCTSKKPGECFQKDDHMQIVYPKLRQADIWVFATPVYWGGMTGPMKNLVDRMVPLLQPFFGPSDGNPGQPPRADTKRGKVVLVSNCGWWDMNIFDLLLANMRGFCVGVGRTWAGALLRPHGPALRPMMEMGMPVDDVFEAAKEAGRQLVRDGEMSTEALNVVSRELLPRETYIQQASQQSQ